MKIFTNSTTNKDNTTQATFTTSTTGTGYSVYPNYVYPYSIPSTTTTNNNDSIRDVMDTKILIRDKEGQQYMLSYGEIYTIEVACSKEKNKPRRRFENLSSDEIKDVIMVNNL